MTLAPRAISSPACPGSTCFSAFLQPPPRWFAPAAVLPPCLSRLDLFPCGVCHLQIHAGTGASAGHQLVFSVLLVLQARKKACFTQPIHLNQLDLWQEFPRPMDEFRCDGRAALRQDLQAAEVVLSCVRELGEGVDH